MHLLGAALLGGLVAGTLDILGAMALTALNGGPPLRAVRSVASGWVGTRAYEGGAEMIALGFATHFAIATLMATAYVVVATRVRDLVRRPWRWGALYGLAMYAVMYLVVLPLRWPALFPSFELERVAGQLFCHVFLVGIPIALIARATR
jgi:uncharacterized membrane protein YagU involved in acid resistance